MNSSRLKATLRLEWEDAAVTVVVTKGTEFEEEGCGANDGGTVEAVLCFLCAGAWYGGPRLEWEAAAVTVAVMAEGECEEEGCGANDEDAVEAVLCFSRTETWYAVPMCRHTGVWTCAALTQRTRAHL